MPLGILPDDDFEKELERLNGKKLPALGNVKEIERGRGEGKVEVPETLRALIGQSALEGNRKEALALARAFDISDSSVSAYSNGATSTASYHNPDKELKRKLDETKQRLTGKARARLEESLDSITPDKLGAAKLRDLSATAQAMSAIVRNLEPQTEHSGANVNVVVYAPHLKEESSFEIIDVRE